MEAGKCKTFSDFLMHYRSFSLGIRVLNISLFSRFWKLEGVWGATESLSRSFCQCRNTRREGLLLSSRSHGTGKIRNFSISQIVLLFGNPLWNLFSKSILDRKMIQCKWCTCDSYPYVIESHKSTFHCMSFCTCESQWIQRFTVSLKFLKIYDE